MKTIGLLLFLFLGSFAPHPFYLSVCDLKYNTVAKKMEGSVKLFTNDLEDALKRLEKKPVDLMHPKDKTVLLKSLDSYLKKRLHFSVNGKAVSYTLLGFENEEDSFWIYLESENCPTPQKFEAENHILYDFLKEQMNILNLEVGAQKKSLKRSNPESNILLEF